MEYQHDLRRGKGSYQRTIRNVEFLYSLGYNLSAKMVLDEHNYVDFIDVLQLPWFDSVLVLPVADFNDTKTDTVNSDRIKQYEEAVMYIYRQMSTYHQSQYSCNCFPNEIAIKYNGEVFPCTEAREHDEYSMGNITEVSIADVISDYVLNNHNKLECKAVEVEKCASCASRAMCSQGCRLRAKHFFGEFNKPDPFNCRVFNDDFSDIAIGTGKLFGIKLMRNFNVPYFSRDIAEFWKRWHISLNTWFVDYVYIPMGGSREGKWKTFRNTFVVFLVSGLWHGANWTYVLWGVFHALLFLPLLLLGKNKRYRDTVAAGKLLPSVSDAWHMLSTFVLVVFGWIIFRAENMREAIDYCYSIVTNWSVSSDIMGIKAVVFICFMLIIEWLHREKEHPFQISIPSRVLRWSFYLFIALLCLTQAGKQVQFIYFQF